MSLSSRYIESANLKLIKYIAHTHVVEVVDLREVILMLEHLAGFSISLRLLMRERNDNPSSADLIDLEGIDQTH